MTDTERIDLEATQERNRYLSLFVIDLKDENVSLKRDKDELAMVVIDSHAEVEQLFTRQFRLEIVLIMSLGFAVGMIFVRMLL